MEYVALGVAVLALSAVWYSRWAVAPAALACVALFWLGTGQERTVYPWIPESTLVGLRVERGTAVWLWLLPDGSSNTTVYKLPYSQEFAEQATEAWRNAKLGPVRVRPKQATDSEQGGGLPDVTAVFRPDQQKNQTQAN